MPSSGTFWIDPRTGALLRSELRTGARKDGLSSIILVGYRHQDRFDMLLPDDMNELYVTTASASRGTRPTATSGASRWRRGSSRGDGVSGGRSLRPAFTRRNGGTEERRNGGAETFGFSLPVHDRVTFVAVPLLLLAVAAVACFVPARRAATLDPLRVLKGS